MPRPPLEARLSDPGFSPGRKDFAELFAVLLGDDEALADKAHAALAKGGSAAAKAGIALTDVPERKAHRVARLLGVLGGEEARAHLEKRLALSVGKERRWVATSLAKVWPEGSEGPLLAVLESANGSEDVRAFVQALGKVGGARTVAALDKITATDPETVRVIEKARVLLARTQARPTEGQRISVDLSRPLGKVTVRLTCREGLESLLADEVVARARRTSKPVATGKGYVTVAHEGSLQPLAQVRTALSIGFEIDAFSGTDKGLAERVTEFVTSKAMLALVRNLEGETGKPTRFRLVLAGHGHARAIRFEVAKLVAATGAPLVNDPTASDFTITVEERGPRLFALVEPKNMEDTRFAWRSRDVPAASHPTIAAALARLSRPSPDDVVWDPFCGSGLELVERAKVARAVAVVGTDVSEDALAAARENVRASGVDNVILELGDSRTHTIPRGLTTVITNPPLGRRVLRGEHADVVSHVLRRVGEALPHGGTLVWVSPSRGFDKVAEGAGLVLERGLDVDLGGFMGRIEVRRKDESIARTDPEHRGGGRPRGDDEGDDEDEGESDDFEIVVSTPSTPSTKGSAPSTRGKRK